MIHNPHGFEDPLVKGKGGGPDSRTEPYEARVSRTGVIPPPIRPDERSTELHPYSPGLCTSLFPGGWPPILDLPISKKIPCSIWFSIKHFHDIVMIN
uniref:Uncharacterized protein n=1 Tax=Oryza punctata TaxID=4537 RepID=A0A0E0MN10_ORYPU